MPFISAFDLFKVGIGPSSSHTVGPMRAALLFRRRLLEQGGGAPIGRIRATLYGSLARTGRGHHTDRAIAWGLSGLEPDRFEAERAAQVWNEAHLHGLVPLSPEGPQIPLDLVFDLELAHRAHPNELDLEALDPAGLTILKETWCSVGGGFISRPEDLGTAPQPSADRDVPHPFSSMRALLARTEGTGKPLWVLMRENERVARTDVEIDEGLARIWSVMKACIDRGLSAEGILPGGLSVRRRAAGLFRSLTSGAPRMRGRPAPTPTDWVHLWAMAVNEENAAGAQVVTAPTNGAAGIVPAVFQYYLQFVDEGAEPRPEVLERYFLTAAAIGALFKLNASISGAEVGCQGEVGSAASMAAAGLCALLGGTSAQIEQAAEIAIEHHLGLTCDPVGGLVQVPCIERNGFGAATAIGAARLAMHEDGTHRVSLDEAIDTVRRTGQDMSFKYKETSLGGLAVSVVEC